ncbi:MAG: hypothetical protein AAF586_05540 [Planctomycetota bacterium]
MSRRRRARRPAPALNRGARAAARRSANIFTRFAIGVLLAAVATLALTPSPPPASNDVFALLWLRGQRPLILLFIAAVAAALILTTMAWPIRGSHRRWLVTAWLLAALVACLIDGERLLAWARLLIVVYG